MNYTEKYHLPQWEEQDRVMRTDFNQMCADIESGLDANAQAAERAQTSADTLPYVLGSYTGTTKVLQVEIGFRPSIVLIFTEQLGFRGDSVAGTVSIFTEEIVSGNRVRMTDTGFIVGTYESSTPYPRVNESSKKYNFIAFR